MIHKQLAPTCGHVRVTFELPSSVWGDRVYVVGDFNQWQPSGTPLKQDREGVWSAVIDLPAGAQYEFCYLIDGKWHTDHHADGSRPNKSGGENSLIDTSLSVITLPRQPAPDNAPERTASMRGSRPSRTRAASVPGVVFVEQSAR